MPPSSRGGKKNFYAVAVGRQSGVFTSWEECKLQVDGFSNARFKSFGTLEEAQMFVDHADHPEKNAPRLPEGVANGPRKYGVLPDDAAVCVGTKRARSPLGAMADGKNEKQKQTREANINRQELVRVLQQHQLSEEWISEREREAVEVYVDGACRANGKGKLAKGGYGGFYGANDVRNFSFPLPTDEPQTNNRAELYALIHVLCTSQDGEYCHNLRVYSDSRYTITGSNVYLNKWLRSGFIGSTGSKVANEDLWKRLNEEKCKHTALYAKRLTAEFRLPHMLALKAATHLALQLIHVRGHSGVPGNEMADRLAVMGSMEHSRQ